MIGMTHNCNSKRILLLNNLKKSKNQKNNFDKTLLFDRFEFFAPKGKIGRYSYIFHPTKLKIIEFSSQKSIL